MKVNVLTGGHIPSLFAHSFNVMKMAQAFYQLSNEVEVVSSFNLPDLFWQFRIKDLWAHYGIDKNIKVKFIKSLTLCTFSWRISNSKIFCKKAAQYAVESKLDLAYCRSYLIPYYCVKLGINTVIETHTTNYDHPDLKKIYTIAQEDNFKALITINEKIKKEHIKRGIPEEKILVLEDGVDLEQFDLLDDRYYWRKELKLPVEKKIVMYCGHLYEDKGIEHILLAAQRFQTKKDIGFVLVGGRNKEIKKWKRYIIKNRINNVHFTGFVNNLDVPKYLKAADVLVMPYKTDMKIKVMDIHTTSPLKLFEYMASKRPIISTNIPTIAKVLENNQSALLAEPNNIAQLSEYIHKLINDDGSAKRLAGNAYKLCRKFEWKERARLILEHIFRE